MACGIGIRIDACCRWSATTASPHVRSCVDGPVFRGDRALDEVGLVPPGHAPERRPLDDPRRDHHRTAQPTTPMVLPEVDMTADLAASSRSSPVLTASGCAAAGRELDPVLRHHRIGAVVTKSIMLAPRSGPSDAARGRDAER